MGDRPEFTYTDYGTQAWSGEHGSEEATAGLVVYDQKKAEALDHLREADSFFIVTVKDTPTDEHGNPRALGEVDDGGHQLVADAIIALKSDGRADLALGHLQLLYQGVAKAAYEIQTNALEFAAQIAQEGFLEDDE